MQSEASWKLFFFLAMTFWLNVYLVGLVYFNCKIFSPVKDLFLWQDSRSERKGGSECWETDKCPRSESNPGAAAFWYMGQLLNKLSYTGVFDYKLLTD